LFLSSVFNEVKNEEELLDTLTVVKKLHIEDFTGQHIPEWLKPI